MARFIIEIEGPVRTKIVYGLDRAIGFFIDITKLRKRRREYDATHPGYDGLPGLLNVLVEEEIATREQVEEALELRLHTDMAQMEDEGVRRVAKIVDDLKTAAGEG